MLWRLSMLGLDQRMPKHLHYILSEFCHIEFPAIACQYYLTDAEVASVIRDLEYFERNWEPRPRHHNRKDCLDSPTRPYTDEDLELAVVCLEWFNIGLKHGARVMIEYV